MPDLASRLLQDSPDLLVLCEYHHRKPGRELAWVLESKGLVFQQPASTNPSHRGSSSPPVYRLRITDGEARESDPLLIHHCT